MNDILRYAPLFIIALLLFAGFQLTRIERQNEGLYNMLRKLLEK